MALKGTIKFSRGGNFSYESETYSGDARGLHSRLKQVSSMYPASKQIFFYYHTEDNIISCVLNSKKLTWFAKAVVPSDLDIKDFKGTYRIRNGKYSITVEIGSTSEFN